MVLVQVASCVMIDSHMIRQHMVFANHIVGQRHKRLMINLNSGLVPTKVTNEICEKTMINIIMKCIYDSPHQNDMCYIKGRQVILRRRDVVSCQLSQMFPWNVSLHKMTHDTHNINKNTQEDRGNRLFMLEELMLVKFDNM